MYLTQDEVARYHRDGYILVKNLFSQTEVAKMLDEVEHGDRVAALARGSNDGKGRAARLALWFDLTGDIWSAVSICPRIVNNVRILLGEETSFFHGKVMLKEARTGGAWEWHQDYGYWYNQGFIYPNMISAFTALDPATSENGCLRVLKGSHKLGRLDHTKVGNQTGADPSRIEQIEAMFEMVECAMSPGDVLFFHCNLLHSSAPNLSEQHRRSFIMCYNAWGNPQIAGDKMIRRERCPVGSDEFILS